MNHKCKLHGDAHEYAKCMVCNHQFCHDYWYSCPSCFGSGADNIRSTKLDKYKAAYSLCHEPQHNAHVRAWYSDDFGWYDPADIDREPAAKRAVEIMGELREIYRGPSGSTVEIL
jgi:hypothetical protein